MGILRLAANYIEGTSPVADWGHLQIVHEGSGAPREIEVQAPLGEWWETTEIFTFAYPPVRDHLDPNNTTGTTDDNTYQIATLNTGTRDPDKVWELLVSIHGEFSGNSVNYLYNLGQNSNSYAYTLLWMVGINAVGVTPPAVNDGFPGFGHNILTNGFDRALSPLTFDMTLSATDADDFLRTGTGEDTLSGLDGEDELYGGAGNDKLKGGNDDDQLFGQDDNDTLIGGRGNDLLDGGEGFDTADHDTTGSTIGRIITLHPRTNKFTPDCTT